MPFGKLYCAGTTKALHYACNHLKEAGFSISGSPAWDIRHLLLDVPSFRPGLWSGEALDTLLAALPRDVSIWGGNLKHPALETYRTIDLLEDESYLIVNADITADCTIPIAESVLKRHWQEVSTLIIGWGRIGKSLSEKLKELGSDVTIFSRSSGHRNEAASQGFHTLDALECIPSFQLIVNTAPAPVLFPERDDPSVKIDLASIKGIAGEDVIWARGLPGKYAPERSGKLIADTIVRLSKEVLS